MDGLAFFNESYFGLIAITLAILHILIRYLIFVGNQMKFNFNWEDVGQVIIGAFALAVPISFSEEAWDLSKTLPLENIAMLFGISIIFLGFYAYQSVFQSNVKRRVIAYILRIVIAYALTLCVVALVLFTLNKLPLDSDPLLAFKRLIIIAMPASMGAIVVDSFDKE